MIESVLRDLLYGIRTLRKSPAFAATTVATLAVGLALVTVVFTIFNAYVLRPFAVRDPYSLHALGWRTPTSVGATFQWREYQDVRSRTDLFDAVLAERTRTVLSPAGRLAASFVTGDYFESLGARVLLGRGLASFDASAPGSHPVAVLSHDAWTRLFAAAPDVVGRSLDLNGRQFAIVGVMSATFQGLDDSPRDLWVPVTMYPELVGEDLFGAGQPRQIRITVRLRDNVPATDAAAALGPMFARTMRVGKSEGQSPSEAIRAELQPQATPAPLTLELLAILSPVFAAFGLVLAAASANVSNIMLARAAARSRELGIRLSIGASRWRVVRQLVTEGVIVGALASAAGLGLALALLRLGTKMLFLMLPPSAAALIRVVPLDFDYRVFLFTAAAAGTASILFAVVPALQATRVSLTTALRGDSAGRVRASTLRSILVAGQVVVSMGLMIGAATLVRNGQRMQAIDIGFETQGVSAVQPRTPDRRSLEQAAATLAADARVERVAAVSHVPLVNVPSSTLAWTAAKPTLLKASHVSVSPEFFDLLGIAIVQGRTFRMEEAAAQGPVAIVNAGAARALWPGESPIGQIVRITDSSSMRRPDDANEPPATTGIPLTVVGVASDASLGLIFEPADRPMVYLPTTATGSRATSLLVRHQPGAPFGVDQAQSLLRPLHADPLAFTALPLAEGVAAQMFPIEVASWIGLLLSTIALALSVSGLYGVVSYSLSQRTRELGIRMALGASSQAMVRLVMGHSARLVVVGGSIGLVVSLAVTVTLRAFVQLDTVAILDVGAFAAAAGVLACAAGIASYLPARRAAAIDPALTLRDA